MSIQETPKGVAGILEVLTQRLTKFSRLATESWAGCSSEEHPGNEESTTSTYVVEPRIPVRTSKEARAVILAISENGPTPDALVPLLVALQEKYARTKEPVFVRLNIAIEFLLDRRLNPGAPIKEAIRGILKYTERSFNGNDLKLAQTLLERCSLKIRALQRSKVKQSKVPRRPKERAEPTHEWLPSWQQQYQREEGNYEDPGDPIWELLSPSEVAFHFRR